MPYPNEHACRLKEPGQFDRIRRDNSKNPNILLGFKGEGSEVQAYRYPTSRWSRRDAASHCSRHGGTFEAASGSQKEENRVYSHFVGLGLKEEDANKAMEVYSAFCDLFEEDPTILDDLTIESKFDEGILVGVLTLDSEHKDLLEMAIDTEVFSYKLKEEEGELKVVLEVRLHPLIRLLPKTDVEEHIEIVDLQTTDNEPFLSDVIESLESPDTIAVCEETLFQTSGKARFVYQTHITGVSGNEERPSIYSTLPCHGKIRWMTEVDGQELVFGLSFPQSRLEEQNLLFTVGEHEPIPVAYIRPPQSSDWFEPEGYVSPGEAGASKHRGAFYITEDSGVMTFGEQHSGYHEILFEGERLKGRWILEYVPGPRGPEWIISKSNTGEI